MSAIWRNHACHLAELINNNNELQAHFYLEQLMLFPVEIQDKIIDEISRLVHCDSDAIAQVIRKYTSFEIH